MESFKTIFSLKLAYLVFAAAEQLSTNFQARDTTVAEGSRGVSLLQHVILHCGLRQLFTTFYQGVVDSSTGLTDEPTLHWYCKAPKRFDEGAQQYCYSSAEDRYCHIYFKVLDHAVGEIERRFNQSDLTLVWSVKQRSYCLTVTSATAERSFPSLRRVKTFLRSLMTQKRLNNLFMLWDVHTTYTDSLDLCSVAEEFVSVNTCQLNYFGKFEHQFLSSLQYSSNINGQHRPGQQQCICTYQKQHNCLYILPMHACTIVSTL